jgi:hypothetical protein
MNVELLLQVPPNMLKLGEKQRIFTWNVHHLIEWTYKAGYEMTFGEAFRTAEQAALNAKSGAGIENSLHTRRLAVDMNLFKNGEWLQKSEDHRQCGMFWESLHPLNRWGGRFSRPDGNHYSMEDGGIK